MSSNLRFPRILGGIEHGLDWLYKLLAGIDATGAPQLIGVTTPVAATGTLTSTGVNVTDGDTVTIGGVTYRFKPTPAQANDVLRGGSAASSLSNLFNALLGVGIGTTSFAETVANPRVTPSALTSTTITLTATNPGAEGNTIATTETAATLSFGATTLTGGVNATLQATASDGGTSWTASFGVAGARFTSADASGAAASVTDAPTTGQKLVITDVEISTDTAMRVDLKEETSGTVIASVYMAANSTVNLCTRSKRKLATVNKKLQVQTSAAGNVSVGAFYYSEA